MVTICRLSYITVLCQHSIFKSFWEVVLKKAADFFCSTQIEKLPALNDGAELANVAMYSMLTRTKPIECQSWNWPMRLPTVSTMGRRLYMLSDI